MIEFKERLKQYRIENNLTQDELANILHVSRQAISKYETGRSYPSIEILQDIAEMLEISVDELISKKELTKQTLDVSNKINKNKIITLCMILVIVILLISSIFIILKLNQISNDKEVINEDIIFCGIVGIPSTIDTISEFKIEDYTANKYFGIGMLVEKDYPYYTVFNTTNSKISYKSESFDFEGTIYLNRKIQRIDFYTVYYNLVTKNYISTITSSISTTASNTSTILEEEHNQNIYTHIFNYVWFDDLIELKIIEFDISGSILKETIYNNEEEYIVNDNMLYIVIEEKLINQNNEEYYNRKIILNEEINNSYIYIIKKENENNIANKSIIFKK